VSRSLEFRLDFFFRIGMDLIYYAINIAFYKIIFLNTGLLGGWTEEQVMVFVGTFLVIDALNMTIFSNNTWWLPIFINRGDLDYYLVRPISPFFVLSLRDFAVNSFMNLLMAIAFLVWVIISYDTPVRPLRFLVFICLLFNGVLLYHLIHVLTLIPVFWTHAGRGFEQIFWEIERSMERPDRIYTGWVRIVLTTILPFSLVASFPARIFLEGLSLEVITHTLVITALFGLVVGLMWKRGLSSYSSASS
jgi:ABC-2 type transport system permease protein